MTRIVPKKVAKPTLFGIVYETEESASRVTMRPRDKYQTKILLNHKSKILFEKNKRITEQTNNAIAQKNIGSNNAFS